MPNLEKTNYRAVLTGMAVNDKLNALQVKAIETALEFISALEVDGTSSSDDGESYMTLGNVDTATLEKLGFRVPRKGKHIQQAMNTAQAAGMIHDSLYLKNAGFGHGKNCCRFLLVAAVPYGRRDDVESLPQAMEAFHRFFGGADWREREFQVFDNEAERTKFFSSNYAEAVAKEEGPSTEVTQR